MIGEAARGLMTRALYRDHDSGSDWLYSTTLCSICATRGTQMWIDNMGWAVEHDWEAWEVDSQVAGYKKKWRNGLILVTVHGEFELLMLPI
jgi:hypothetical protein